jgi:hypothetical protein
MTVPTITTITPGTGLTKGVALIVIEGTNFRLPPTPSAGYHGGDAQQTVTVSFGGTDSQWAHAVSATRVHARLPEWDGDWRDAMPKSLDVRVANLDDAGVEIPGEEVTAVDGMVIDRPKLSKKQDMHRVVLELLRVFRRHLHINTWLNQGREFDEDPTDARDKPNRSSLPLIALEGPSTQINRFSSLNRMEPTEDAGDPGSWYRYRFPVTVDMTFDVTAYANSETHLLSLGAAFTTLFRDVIYLRVPRDVGDPTKGTADYELAVPFDGQPDYQSPPELDDLHSFAAVVTIRGVDIDESEGIVIERGVDLADDPSLETQEI